MNHHHPGDMVVLTEQTPSPKPTTRTKKKHVKVRTGCITCKNRRIKCDETRPQCLRCCRTGWACEGYPPPQIWVFEPHTQPVSPQPISQRDESPEDDEGAAKCKTASRFRMLTKRMLVEGVPLTTSKFSTQSVYRDPLLGSLLERWTGPTPVIMQSTSGEKNGTDGSLMPVAGAWPQIGCVASKSYDDGFLVTAFVSLASCLIGFQENDPVLTASGLRGYQTALREIRRVVDAVASKKTDSVERHSALIAACMACALTEYIGCLSNTNADSHLDGIAMIIERAGPSRLHDRSFRQLFLDHRALYLGVCFPQKRAMFYSKREWIEGSWKATDMSANTFMQKLCDIGYIIVPLIEEYDRTTDHSEKSLWLFSERASAFDRDLTEWHEGVLAALPPSAIHTVRSTCLAFPHQIRFPGLGIATAIRYYHAIKIYVAFLFLNIAQTLQRKDIDTTQWTVDIAKRVIEHAQLICQSMEYLYDKSHRAVGVSTSMFPLDAAWQAFETAQPILNLNLDVEREWFVCTAARNSAAGFKLFREPWIKES